MTEQSARQPASRPAPGMLVIKTGSAPDAIRRRFDDFEQWFARAIGPERFGYHTIDVSRAEPLPDSDHLDGFAGVVVTGSPAMVSHRHDWSETTAGWLAAVIAEDRLPVLGVCYGHQLIAHALGGRVGPNPAGRRMGTRELSVEGDDDPLLGALAPRTPVHVTHLEAVLHPPAGARVLGRTEGDACHALHFGGRSWGVQFHPEFDGAIMRSYLEERAELLDQEGFDSRALLAAVAETDAGSRLFERFAAICANQPGNDHAAVR